MRAHLRSDCERLGFAPGFTIYDDSDSKSLVKRIMAELNIDPKRYPESMVRNRISKAKNELVRPRCSKIATKTLRRR